MIIDYEERSKEVIREAINRWYAENPHNITSQYPDGLKYALLLLEELSIAKKFLRKVEL